VPRRQRPGEPRSNLAPLPRRWVARRPRVCPCRADGKGRIGGGPRWVLADRWNTADSKFHRTRIERACRRGPSYRAAQKLPGFWRFDPGRRCPDSLRNARFPQPLTYTNAHLQKAEHNFLLARRKSGKAGPIRSSKRSPPFHMQFSIALELSETHIFPIQRGNHRGKSIGGLAERRGRRRRGRVGGTEHRGRNERRRDDMRQDEQTTWRRRCLLCGWENLAIFISAVWRCRRIWRQGTTRFLRKLFTALGSHLHEHRFIPIDIVVD
jgi:hypothetical protein